MIEALRKKIMADTGVLTIPANTTAKRPPEPFSTVYLALSHMKDTGHPDLVTVETEDGLYTERREAYQVTLSFTFYTQDDFQAAQMAQNVRTWFDFQGYEWLSGSDLVVVDLGNIENRTTFLVDSYEYKHGFDVRLRTTRIDRMPIEPMENVTLRYNDRIMRTTWSEAVDLIHSSEEAPVVYLRAGDDVQTGMTL